jgi:hypothetical protein
MTRHGGVDVAGMAPVATTARQAGMISGRTMSRESPQMPITVRWGDGEREEYDSLVELGSSLEWFDSDDPGYQAQVHDALGRPVRLKIDHLEVRPCELA